MEVVRAISEAAADNIQAIPQSVRFLYAQSAFCTQDITTYNRYMYVNLCITLFASCWKVYKRDEETKL